MSADEENYFFLTYTGMAAILVMWREQFEYFFSFNPGGSVWNLYTIGLVALEMFEIFKVWEPWAKNDLDFLYS